MSKAAVKVVSESRVTWAGLSLCQFWSSYRPLYSRLRPDVCDKQTSATDRRQTNASPISGGGHGRYCDYKIQKSVVSSRHYAQVRPLTAIYGYVCYKLWVVEE